MKRREFVKKAAASFIILNSVTVFDLFSSSGTEHKLAFKEGDLAEIDTELRKNFNQLIDWIKQNGWEDYIKMIVNLDNLYLNDDVKLSQPLTNINNIRTKTGFEDFGGDRLITPGKPSLSLLYHALASPRVKNPELKAYPSIEYLDILEDYIYSLEKWDANIYSDKRKYRLAILSYEYRPAYKIPPYRNIDRKTFKKQADFVYSRTGISRIGKHDPNFDTITRSFTNKPKDENDLKGIAVTPARYGLFLVELIKLDDFKHPPVTVLNREDKDEDRYFIKPIRKIVKNNSFDFTFEEYHLNEKLFKLSQFEYEKEKKIEIYPANLSLNTYPFRRVSCSSEKDTKHPILHQTDRDMVSLQSLGSSVILFSVPLDLIVPAVQQGHEIGFRVPACWKKSFFSNRRYAAYKFIDPKSKDGFDAFLTDGLYRKNRITSRFGTPRNAPMFANIKFKQNNNQQFHHIDCNVNFENDIEQGDYIAQLFEDNICDGCITVSFTQSNFNSEDVLPAFSMVTAPDFFPYVDSNDLNNYYNVKGIPQDEHFLEGGTLNLSGLRLKANSNLINPVTLKQAFTINDLSWNTVLSIVSLNSKQITSDYNINYNRDYKSSSHLTDTSSGIFYPGWDATFSNSTNENERFVATYGLGSPFPEDMKLCAAANGMWPVASPDAGRTFQGSLDKIPGYNRKPGTSVPLMDDEIGYHPNSPYGLKKAQTYGWDGEQGPFIKFDAKDKNKLVVNFTDIGRADYLANLLDPAIGFNMSKLRYLESSELIIRMDCLRSSIRAINKNTKVEFTKYWLISAEKVFRWEDKAYAYGIPDNLIGTDNEWAKKSDGLKESGYLFVFALTEPLSLTEELEDINGKRRNQKVTELCVCKVAKKDMASQTNIKYVKLIPGNLPSESNQIQWKAVTK